MENPSSWAKGKGVKEDSYEFESESESSPRNGDRNGDRHTFVDNNIHGKMEMKGLQWIAEDDSFCRLTDRDILQMKFCSEEEAHLFYNAYAKANGFSIRKWKSKPLKGNDIKVRYRVWVCSKEGKRQKQYLELENRTRRHRPETRTECRAKFRVCYERQTETYIVTHFEREHNHELAAPHCVPFLRSHRFVNSADQAQATAMRKVGVKQSQIMDFVTCQAGGYHNVGYTNKDLRNKLDRDRREQLMDGDAEGALGYLSAKGKNDPMFFFKYTVDDNDRLEALFWTDGRSRTDYAAFGDVLVFDTTYRTNAYKKPFVILAGVSNHFTTTIFGCALLASETEETYNWVLSSFVEAMDGKQPISVITDGDLAMRNAIGNIFPTARHRLCTWHLERNACKNVHIPEFVSDFTKLMQMECHVEEFETLWSDVVSHYRLQRNSWVLEVYNDRERWAEAYLLGHFFGGMRSTQRCEGLNSYLKRFITVKLRLFEFVEQYDRGLERMRIADAEVETATEHSSPILVTQLRSLEKHATDVYTHNIFKMFQDEILRESALVVGNRVDEGQYRRLYYLEHYSRRECKWMVEYYPIDNGIKCCCLMFESFGLPCCHMIAVMKYEHLPTIPPTLIMERWTRRARPQQPTAGLISPSPSTTSMARYGILSSAYNLMSFYASHSNESYQHARQLGNEMTACMRERWERVNKVGTGPSSVGSQFNVRDPAVVKTKGNPGKNSKTGTIRKQRKCRVCQCVGHDKRTCPKKLKSNEQ